VGQVRDWIQEKKKGSQRQSCGKKERDRGRWTGWRVRPFEEKAKESELSALKPVHGKEEDPALTRDGGCECFEVLWLQYWRTSEGGKRVLSPEAPHPTTRDDKKWEGDRCGSSNLGATLCDGDKVNVKIYPYGKISREAWELKG